MTEPSDLREDRDDRPAIQQRMVALLSALTPMEGYTQTPLPDVRFLRSNRPLARAPVLYEPGVVIVCQGSKRGYLGDRVYVYDAQHYLAVSVPVPFTMETDASAAEPMLAIYFRLDFNVAADLVLALEERSPSPLSSAQNEADETDDANDAHEANDPKGMVSTRLDDKISASVLHFLEIMSDPVAAPILGPGLVREIYFRVLTGEQGASMRAALTMEGRFGRIAKAIRKIHRCFDEALDVEQLANEATMSVPSFHAHFKAVTDTSPIQYLKSTRLHQARLLMVRNDITAASACLQVGYESPSQFSREFRRLFGRSPGEEVDRMRKAIVD